MNSIDKNKHKADFKSELDKFAEKLERYVSTDNGDWTVKGFIDVFKNIFTISADTKIISKILEIHIFPQLLQFAEDNDYKIVFAEKQNWYPDITFIADKNEAVKFALDIKRLLDAMTRQRVLLWAATARISRKEIKTKTFNFLTINTWDIIVSALFIREHLPARIFPKRIFIRLKNFKKAKTLQIKKLESAKLRLLKT